MCSNRWANPVLPGRSFAEPTWYHTLTATIGAASSGDSVTNNPFGNRTVLVGIRMILNCTTSANPTLDAWIADDLTSLDRSALWGRGVCADGSSVMGVS